MAKHTQSTEEDVVTRTRRQTRKPRLYRVLLHNDDYTTMDFVVDVLKRIFHKSDAEAVHIMLTVHHKQVGVAGVFTRETAESKVDRVHRFARENQHPLRCSMEPESK